MGDSEAVLGRQRRKISRVTVSISRFQGAMIEMRFTSKFAAILGDRSQLDHKEVLSIALDNNIVV
jgi:hypothetical protein